MNRAVWALLVALTTLHVLVADASAGQFKLPAYYRAGQRPYRVIAAQFTQSGNLDLAVADFVTSRMYILLGNGDGTFRQSGTGKLGVYSANLAVADLNGDGHLDVAVANRGFDRPGN